MKTEAGVPAKKCIYKLTYLYSDNTTTKYLPPTLQMPLKADQISQDKER